MKLVVCLVLVMFLACGSNPPAASSPGADLGSAPVWIWCDDEGPGGGTGPDGFERITDAGVRQVMVDVANDPFYCGGCDVFCLITFGITGADPDERVRNYNTVDARCVAGQCVFQCRAGRGNCDGNRANGCEADTNADRNHCSVCSKACPPDNQNFIRFCRAGNCQQTRR